jgi:hypothetical protein
MLKKSLMMVVTILLMVFTSYAEIPKMMNYQGMLTDANGKPIDGTRSITFGLFGTETGGVALWTETHKVSIKEGDCSM